MLIHYISERRMKKKIDDIVSFLLKDEHLLRDLQKQVKLIQTMKKIDTNLIPYLVKMGYSIFDEIKDLDLIRKQDIPLIIKKLMFEIIKREMNLSSQEFKRLESIIGSATELILYRMEDIEIIRNKVSSCFCC